jgi:glyoxylase-like metal-dependent hydrolase (beta-lactamase superfamily II)
MSEPRQVTSRAQLVLAPNPGPMTLDGTNSWVLREPDGDRCVVVDPGPADEGHLGRLAALGPVALVVLTHGHLDHSEGAPRLRELTGAPVTALDPALCLAADPLDVAGRGGRQSVAGLDWLTILTPGHSSDSVCLLLEAESSLLTGDTVLGRGTTVVAHPDGRLADYLDSLRRLRDLADREVDRLLPGHGPVLDRPADVLDHYLAHRRDRLDQVRAAVAGGAFDAADGDVDAAAVVRQVYADVDRSLWPAAELSVRAQLDYLRDTANRENQP